MKHSICIIPARGGSKRIPRKNIRDFLGKPIIAYSIETALKSNLFDEVMVSTDDEEIAEVSRHYGARVPFMRSKQNSDDYASTIDVLKEVLQHYKVNGKSYNYTCCLYPTAPFATIKQLEKGFTLMNEKKLNTVFPVVPFSYPIWRGLVKEKGQTKMIWPEYKSARSQDIPLVYHDAGLWYWININTLGETLWGELTDSIILNESEVQDIDNISDWELAELKYKIMMANNLNKQ